MSDTNITDSSGSSNNDDAIPKAVITVAVIAVAFIIGIIVAKLVDMCHDRQTLRDDASDISDYTKELLKIQFMMAFKKKGGKETPEDIARRMVKLWRISVVKKKRMRKMEAKKAAMANKEASEDKDKTQENDSKNKDVEKGALNKANGKGKEENKVPVAQGAKAKEQNTLQVPKEKERKPPPLKAKPAPPVKVTTVNEVAKPQRTDAASSEKDKPKPNNNTANDTPGKPGAADTNAAANPAATLPILCSEPAERPDVPDVVTMKNGAKPSILTKRDSGKMHRDYVEFRADSDDLMIPVSTDEDPKPTLQVTSGRRASGSSKSDYEFLRDPEFDTDRTDTGTRRDRDVSPTKTPSSLSAVKLENRDKPSKPAQSRPETSKSRAGPISARPKSSAPPFITPTGRRPVSGKIVTAQGVKVVSRPKTPAAPKKS